MKQHFKPHHFTQFVWLLGLLLGVKLFWFAIELLFLPSSGINQEHEQRVKALYYRVKLAPKEAPAPTVTKVKKPVVRKVQGGNISNLKLLGIYNAGDVVVVTVTYRGASKVLSKGENINGFVLESAGLDYAIFSKDAKSYKVMLEKSKLSPAAKQAIRPHTSRPERASKAPTAKVGSIRDEGDRKVVDKSLIKYYKKNYKEIGKNIGIIDSVKDGVLDGFKVTFVRRGSDFAKLGLRRNDIIKAVNGEPVKDYRTAMEIYNRADTMENMTLTIMRGNEEKELEYEVN